MAVNKVEFGGNTLIDLTEDSLESADQLLEGVTAHSRSGSVIVGTLKPEEEYRKSYAYNLLDNSDFTNPVNQRNISSGYTISDYAYFWDRWRSASANACEISFGNNGLSTTTEVLQSILNAGRYVGKVLTVALYLYDGTNVVASGTVPDASDWNSICYSGDGSNFVRLARSGDVLEVSAKLTDVIHIALYEGEYTAETLPEYQPKGYGAELAECQRYYQIRSANNVAAVDMRPTMRLNNPTITSVTDGYAYSADL